VSELEAKSSYSFESQNILKAKEEIPDYVRLKMVSWRRGPALVRVEKPTKIARARSLGYKDKPGFVVVRIRIRRGDLHRRKIMGGRRPRRYGYNKLTHGKSEKWIAEERVQDKYPNLSVLNSYYLAEDGKYKFFEVILVDPSHPNIKNDPHLSWTGEPANIGRVYRGLTSSGKKARGLRKKGKGSEKSRPSIRANGRLRRH